MPYVDGVFEEPDNGDRASWATAAVHAYAEQTRNDPREQEIRIDGPEDQDGKDHAEEVISDLLGDLRHLCRELGLDFDELSERGNGHYEYEVAEEAELAKADAEEEGEAA